MTVFNTHTQISINFTINIYQPLTSQQEHQGNDPRNLHSVLDPTFLEVQMMDLLDSLWK